MAKKVKKGVKKAKGLDPKSKKGKDFAKTMKNAAVRAANRGAAAAGSGGQ